MATQKSTTGLWALAAGATGAAGLMIGFLIGVGLSAVGADPAGEDEGGGPGGPPPAMVRVGTAEVRPLQDRVSVTGRLREVRRVEVTAEVAGKLINVGVDEGDAVEGGKTVLARVDPVWTTLQFKAAEAEVAEAEAELRQSQLDLDQLTRLRRDGSAKQKEVDDATTAVAANEARLAAAEARLGRARTERDRLVIVAPFDGTVTAKMAEVGKWVEPGDGVVEIISAGAIDAEVDVPERAVNAVAALMARNAGDADNAEEAAVAVLVDALRDDTTGERLAVGGTVRAVTPDGTNPSRTFPVKVRLDNAKGRLKPGMSVTALFPLGEPQPTLTVPRDAVLFSQLTPRVWVSMKDPEAPPEAMPAAVPVDVRVRFGAGDRFAVEVLNGPLFPGAEVIVEGAESVFPGQPLMYGGEPGVAAVGDGNKEETPEAPAEPTGAAQATSEPTKS